MVGLASSGHRGRDESRDRHRHTRSGLTRTSDQPAVVSSRVSYPGRARHPQRIKQGAPNWSRRLERTGVILREVAGSTLAKGVVAGGGSCDFAQDDRPSLAAASRTQVSCFISDEGRRFASGCWDVRFATARSPVTVEIKPPRGEAPRLVGHEKERRQRDPTFASSPVPCQSAGRGIRRGLDGPTKPNKL
jgi:hypothetical protein